MTDNQILRHSKFWDRAGIFVAGLCLVHCILFPVMILLLPATRAYFHNPVFEGVILFFGILVGSISFTTTYRKHRQPYPLMLGLTGVLLLSINLFVLYEWDIHMEVFGLPMDPLLVLGGLFLIVGHFWNIHACHCFCEKDCHHEEHQPH